MAFDPPMLDEVEVPLDLRVLTPTLLDLAAEEALDLDTAEERFFLQRQSHAVEIGVLQKRLQRAGEQLEGHQHNSALARWESERDLHVLRGHLLALRVRVAALEARNEVLEAELSGPWWTRLLGWRPRQAA